MSLLAAFVAMLGKQWLNRYLRHTGGSMIERCGDRQRKFDGLKKWPFHLFIESLSIMLQIALLLLTCGLSRYMWSINTSVAFVVITSTILGVIFYVGVVMAGMSSYECPFQTPVSTVLRTALRDDAMGQRLLETLSPHKISSFVRVASRWAQKRLVLVCRQVRNVVMNPPRLSSLVTGVCATGRKVGHLVIAPLHRVSWIFETGLSQWIQERRNTPLLPITTKRGNCQLHTRRVGGLLVYPRNLENLWKQNADNARCVCWVLRNITDPEAIVSALRLASTVRWFEDDVDVDPPYDVILSSFQDCFDPNKEAYPGMEDRVLISGKALVQIHVCAALRSDRFKYPIPEFPWNCSPRGLLYFMYRLKLSAGDDISEAPANMLWMSGLFVAIARLSPNPSDPYPREGLAYSIHGRLGTSRAMDGNILLAWYVTLGGLVEEETFWADDKSCVVFISLFYPSQPEIWREWYYLSHLKQ